MKSAGQACFEAYHAFLGSIEVPWEAIGARHQAAWEHAASVRERKTSSSSFAAVGVILDEAKKGTGER